MQRLTPNQPILIVEDSDDDYEATQRALKKDGNLLNPIYRCEDGEDAMDFLLNQGDHSNPEEAPKPGLILLDLNMPGKDGRKVLDEIKSNSSLQNIPVIVLTTSDDERDVEDCYRNGANSYIKKPVDLDGFFESIKRLKEYWFEVAILPKGTVDETNA